MTVLVPLAAAADATRFGGKAAGLARSLAANLRVPPGAAIAWDDVERIVGDDAALGSVAADVHAQLGAIVAVRSSAVGEDGEGASFAGQHATCLGVRDVAGIATAIRAVHASASTESALAYRRRLGLDLRPRMAIVVQRVVVADVAGVLFTRNPVTGADERVIEAAWGFGEAVVQGLVAPDLYRLARGGELLEARTGDKDLRVVLSDRGGTREAPVPADRAGAATLDAAMLRALEALATQCEHAFDGPRDLEWAIADDELWLLQCRAVTR